MGAGMSATPGPWEFRPQSGKDMGGFYAPTDRVCWFGDETTYYPSEGEPPSAEDARLIAAAPDLLAALRRAEEMLRIAGPLVAKFAAEEEVFYDGANCDGTCIAEDCGHAAEDAAEAIAKAVQP